VARALAGLPLVRAAFERGELSYSKVRALTRVATEADEADLVRIALEATAAQLERIVGAYRGALSLAAAVEADRRRHLTYRWEEDGSLSFRGRLGATEGDLFLRALAAGRELAGAIAEADGGPSEPPAHDPRRASNADALAAMAEACLASAAADSSGGDRHQLVVHVDGARAELEGGPALAAETARRLACDASIVAIAESGGEALSVGRRTRTIPPSIRRALRSRDGGCRFPGCGAHRSPTPTTSATGPTAGRPRSRTSSCSADATTASSTSTGSRSPTAATASSSSAPATAGSWRRARRPRGATHPTCERSAPAAAFGSTGTPAFLARPARGWTST
jgi:hypothetical protein